MKVKKIIFYSIFFSSIFPLVLTNRVLACDDCGGREVGATWSCIVDGQLCDCKCESCYDEKCWNKAGCVNPPPADCPPYNPSGCQLVDCKRCCTKCGTCDTTCPLTPPRKYTSISNCRPPCHPCTPSSCCIPVSCPGGTASLKFAQNEENKNEITNIFSPPSQIVFRPKSAETINLSPNPNTAPNSWNDLLIQLKEIINKIISPWRQLGMLR